ncbi:hypothetical protein EG829_18925 [bacterium]|nr:hypothetical protein [bacterium]
MLSGMHDLGYAIKTVPPYTFIYRETDPDLPARISQSQNPGMESHITGRANIRIIEPDLVVRKLTHGGLLRHVTGSRFLGPGRSLRELSISAYLISRGIPTPEIAALRFSKEGLFYSIDVISRLVPDSVDLLTYMEAGPDDCLLRLSQAGRLISEVHGQGVYHTDLHVKNILLDREKSPWIIDLDNAYRLDSLPEYMKKKNIRRFIHSLKKWGAKGRISLPQGWKQAFLDGYNG